MANTGIAIKGVKKLNTVPNNIARRPRFFLSPTRELFMGTLYEYAISTLTIRPFNESLRDKGVPGCKISSNGTFYFAGKHGGVFPAGPSVIPDPAGAPKGYTREGGAQDKAYIRGGVGVVRGQILVRELKHAKGNDVAMDAGATFGGPPTVFMGGGFMIIKDGEPVDDGELQKVQHYSTSGHQLDTSNHILIGNRKSSAYLIVALAMDYLRIRNALRDYSDLCLFDGGKAFWVRTPELRLDGYNKRVEPPYFAVGASGSLLRKI